MLSEKIELLGKNVYKDIPGELTLKSIPTASELDYVSSENFNQTMLDKILPQAVEEKINFRQLLEIDFYWICRCLRFLNYGPYHTVNMIFCPKCGSVRREMQVDLRSIECKPLPEDFVNDVVIPKGDLIDFQGDIHLHLLTIQEMINAGKDKLFIGADGRTRSDFARMCYMITSIGKDKDISPVNAKLLIEKNLSPADYSVLKDRVDELTDFGLRAGGRCTCPSCGDTDAAFAAFVDDRFFRATVGDIRRGRDDRHTWGTKDVPGSETTTV